MNNGDSNSITVRNKILRASLIILIIGLLAIFLRLHFLSMHFYNQADALHSAGSINKAVQSYCWTIRNYYPGSTFSQYAVDKIITIADYYHAEKQFDQEIATLQQLRASIYSIQSYYHPYSKTLQQINARLQSVEQNIPAESIE